MCFEFSFILIKCKIKNVSETKACYYYATLGRSRFILHFVHVCQLITFCPIDNFKDFCMRAYHDQHPFVVTWSNFKVQATLTVSVTWYEDWQ